MDTFQQCPGRFLGIIGRVPNISKSNWLHVDILRFPMLKAINAPRF